MPRHEGQTRSTRSRNHRAMRSGKKKHQTPLRKGRGRTSAPIPSRTVDTVADARTAGRHAAQHADALTERFLEKG